MVDNSFEKEMDDFVQDLPLAKIGLQYLKRATNNNILSKITNLGKGRTTSSSGMPSGIVYGEFQDPSLNPAYRLTSENAETALDVNNPDFKLSAALDDPDKRVWTSHELSHLGMALLRKSGLIDNKTYLKYEKARRANDSKLSEDFYRVSKAHLQIKGGEQRALELQGRPFEGESKVRFKNKKGELEVFELPSLDLINDLANTWLEKNANDPSNKSINYGNALKEEVNFLKKEQASKDTARNPEQINYTIDNTMPMIKPSIGESIKKEIREKEEASENPLFLPPQKETDLSTYAKGGDTMPMEQQMEMFAVGGLDDDGLSRDPVSGNEIPPGSMANEVRDDVEARLSDGEYVVPANVVRFFGVKFFEDLRTQAMRGLSAMEANGRIGGEPVPSAMSMQDQMAQGQPPISDGEMEMLQSMMNKGGYIQGYQTGGTPDFENPSNYPFNPSPFSTVGASFFSPYNPNVTPDPNVPIPEDPGPNPESGISFVTMVNPATGEIQVVQFMGGNPVDANAYNQLLSNGFYVQGSPELAAYKQKMAEDNREEPDTTTRPHPSEASISQLGQLIAESSKGGGSLLEMIPGITGAVTGKLATDYRNDISKALAKTIADTNLSDAQRNAAQLLQNVWTNADLSAKQRKDAIAKAGIFKQPSIKNALGKKAGKYMSENWFGLATKEQLEKQFGSEKTTTKAMTDALNLTEKKFKADDGFYGSKDDFKIDDIDYRFGVTGSGGVDGDSGGETLGEFGGSGPNVDSSGNITNDNNDTNNNNTSGGSNNNNTTSNNTYSGGNPETDFAPGEEYSSSGPTIGFGGFNMNKGGLLKKPTKKKTKKKKTKKY
jgi:hypothetical protein